MRKRKNTKIIPYILRQTGRNIQFVAKKLIKTVIRTFLRILQGRQRRPSWSRAGFVLPTVTMVMLVVILLTIAISLRSFDRAQEARNVRVSQAVLSAAAPALDRARAKLEELLVTNPPTTDTPTDDALYLELTTTVEIENPDGSTDKDDKYTFDDEQKLQIAYDLNDNDTIDENGENDDETTIEDNEITKTAWRFPVDTDNNGKYDSYTVYGIFFRSPEREGEGFKSARSPLDARTPPMPPAAASQSEDCKAKAGTSSSMVGGSGWYKSNGKLKKSFFVYTVTVPITDTSVVTVEPQNSYTVDDFETFKGTTGFSALEYQQDWQRIPLTNNAVVYEDDLEIAPGPDFRLNGRIQANSNLIISSEEDNDIELYLISSKNSCFYQDEENSKIIVGGNVINGLVADDDFSETIDVHLQRGTTVEENSAEISKTNQSVTSYTTTDPNITNDAQASAYNSDAYASRIGWLVDEHISNYPTTANGIVTEDPSEVRTKVDESTNKELTRKNALESYFKKLVRKVPFAEVPQGTADTTVTLDTDGKPTDTLTTGTGDELRPAIDSWVLPTDGDINVGETTGETNLTLNVEQLEATNPAIVEENDGNQYFVGDRVLVGNNLPQKVWNSTAFASGFQQQVDGTTNWLDQDGDDSGVLRYREPRVAAIADVGSTDRDGFWEDAAATAPEAALDGIGGLRVITGAGVYDRINSFLPPPPTNASGFTVVWPDTMPMSPAGYSRVYDNVAGKWDANLYKDATTTTATPTIDPNTPKYAKGDLRMRATAVYHYANDFINDTDDTEQKPIACISSYYDPSTSATAASSNASTNGIVYGPPTTSRPGKGTYDSSTQKFTDTSGLLGLLAAQANMVFPDGRFVNEKLRDALENDDADRSLSEQAAIDTTMCSLGILGNSEVALGTAPTYITNGAIKEIAFLDARQIKASDPDNLATSADETFTRDAANFTSNYNLPLEERQPLEIRATQIDLGVLRQAGFTPTTTVGPRRDGKEYLLPFSGIIYASRDDALPDRSDQDSTSNEDLANSAYDYQLDPTRRPNGIMLINGGTVKRPEPSTMTTEEVTKEKGLTLVSNLPVYIQGDFNLHKNSSQSLIEEFDDRLENNWSDFYTRDNSDGNFACRAKDPRLSACIAGDDWRAVNILADSLTLLSNAWRPGFRNEGDFDLRNNAGNGAVMAKVGATELTAQDVRRNHGFFANNYATNGLSSNLDLDGAGTVYTTAYNDTNYRTNSGVMNSSYFNNFVTPVQRRVNFREYVMEICLKLPVSACEAEDWVVGTQSGGTVTSQTRTLYELFASSFTDGTIPANTNFATVNLASSIAADTLVSGTTATMPPLEFQRFPRRVAFLRNQYGELEMSGKFRPIPVGVNTSGNVQAYPYNNSTALPRSVDNALWFRTTDNSSSPFQSPVYKADKPLFYLGYNFDNPDSGGGKPRLPSTPKIEVDGVDYSLTIDDDSATTDNEDQLYSPSNYVMCIANARTSKEYYLASNIGGSRVYNQDSETCPLQTATAIQTFRTNMQGLTADATWTAGNVIEDVDGDNLVVYNLPGTLGGASTSTTITLQGNSSTVFVLRGPTNTDLTFDAGGVILDLQNLDGTVNRGVDPNNIFWISDKGVVFKNTTNKHLLVGNFIGKYDSGSTNYLVEIGTNTKILGGRFLGFKGFRPVGSTSGLSSSNVPAGVDIRAITAGAGSGYVNLVPVLQIHEPDADKAGTVDGMQGNKNATAWLPRPTTSPTFNLVAAVADTPSRPGQSNGGLQNFVRFQENWQLPTKNTVNISGAFIQLGRSKYATASQQHVKKEDAGATPPVVSDLFAYDQYYYVGANSGVLGFQTPPERAWGFDVGLLSQSPDLFAQKFTLPSSDNKPDEYFREVSRDDDWVKGLLCGKVEDDGTTHAVNRPSGLDCKDEGYDDQ